MILNFPGGVRPNERTIFGKQKIKYIDSCSAVCIEAAEDAEPQTAPGAQVAKGALIGSSGGTPVYSSVSGIFRGIAEISGGRYFVVINNNSQDRESIFEPECRPLTQMTREDIIESAKKLSVIDSRSGMPLWKLIDPVKKYRRVVIDCTESDPKSAVNYRLCLEKAKSVVGGAKILLQATGALKCVFAMEHYRNAAFDALAKYAPDEKLFAAAMLEEKYPYGDRAIMSALYLKTLRPNETPADHGVLIVGVETACALFDSMASGVPQLNRYISYCGETLAGGGNLCVPRGMTLHDLNELWGGLRKGVILVENSLLSGSPFKGAVKDKTRSVIAVMPEKKPRSTCISCGKCVSACPVKLFPKDVLSGNSKKLKDACVACGACQYICPSGIPLLELIKSNKPQKSAPAEREV